MASTSASPASAHDYTIAPWTEAVVSVTDLDESASWLVEDGDWRVTDEGDLTRAQLSYWKLPETVTSTFKRICAAKANTGCIRFVRFKGAKNQRPIRRAARPWDTGGIFSIMMRSDNAQAMFEAAIARGWWAESDPYEFSFGGSDLVNVVIRGPHGVNYAVYERKAPAFTGFPVGRLSQAFNTMRMVKDQPASLQWYRQTLGLKTLFDAPFTDPEARPNNLSVPSNLATTLVRRAAVVQPALPGRTELGEAEMGETGRMELMQFEGFDGRDFSAYASPPNLGIISVRYPVKRLASYRRHLEELGADIAFETTNLEMARGVKTPAFALRDPDGNLTEFYAAR